MEGERNPKIVSTLWADCEQIALTSKICEQIVSRLWAKSPNSEYRNLIAIASTLWAHCEHIVSKLRYERNLWAHCDIPKFAINCAICEHIALICTHSAIGRNMLTICSQSIFVSRLRYSLNHHNCSQSAHNVLTNTKLWADCAICDSFNQNSNH